MSFLLFINNCASTKKDNTEKIRINKISLNKMQDVYKFCLLEENESYQSPLRQLFSEIFEIEDYDNVKTRLELDYNLERDAYILIHGRIYSGNNTLYFSHNSGSTIKLQGIDKYEEKVDGILRLGTSLEELKTSYDKENDFYNKYGKNIENERILVEPKIDSKYMDSYQDSYPYLSEDKKEEIKIWQPFNMKGYISCLQTELKESKTVDYIEVEKKDVPKEEKK